MNKKQYNQLINENKKETEETKMIIAEKETNQDWDGINELYTKEHDLELARKEIERQKTGYVSFDENAAWTS